MGGKSGSKAASQEAAQARREEQMRQDRIRRGTGRINALFDGGVVTDGRVGGGAEFDKKATYYLEDGSVWEPPAAGAALGAPPPAPKMSRTEAILAAGGRNDDPRRAAQTAENKAAGPDPWREAVKDGLYTKRTEKTGAFGDGFFDEQRDRFVDYAMPQLDDQKSAADRDLLFAMARSGNTESSARASLSGELEKRAGLARQQVLDEGQGFANKSRTDVENARADLISMLNVTGDAQGAANSARARAAALSQPAGFSPISNLFADFTGALATQAGAERAAAAGGPPSTFNTGLFGPRKNAVQVT